MLKNSVELRETQMFSKEAVNNFNEHRISYLTDSGLTLLFNVRHSSNRIIILGVKFIRNVL